MNGLNFGHDRKFNRHQAAELDPRGRKLLMITPHGCVVESTLFAGLGDLSSPASGLIAANLGLWGRLASTWGRGVARVCAGSGPTESMRAIHMQALSGLSLSRFLCSRPCFRSRMGRQIQTRLLCQSSCFVAGEASESLRFFAECRRFAMGSPRGSRPAKGLDWLFNQFDRSVPLCG